MQSRSSFILQRTGIALATILAASFLLFLLLELSPEIVAIKVLGPYTSESQRQLWLELNGYFEPFFSRYLIWIGQMVVGDFGESIRFKVAISEVLWHRLGQSALLVACVLVLLVPLSLAVTQATRRDSGAHSILATFGFVITAVPEFVSALILITVFSYYLGVLPGVSAMAEGFSVEQLVLPVLALVIFHLGHTLVRARGPADKSAASARLLLSTLSQAFAAITWLLAGLIPIEFIFAYKGFGSLFLEALLNQDLFLIEACAIVGITIVVLAWLLADVLQALATPSMPQPPPAASAVDEAAPSPITGDAGAAAASSAEAFFDTLLIVLGSAILGLWVLLAFGASVLAPYDPSATIMPLAFPGSRDGAGGIFWLGTDHIGRDILSRTLWGASRVLVPAVLATFGAYLLGAPVGLIAGRLKRKRPLAPLHASEVALSFLLLAFCLLVISTIGASALHIIIVVAIAHAVGAMRSIRDLTADPSQLTLRNVVAGLVLHFGLVVTTLVLLGFLGLGWPPPAPEWGGMINETRMMMAAFPYMVMPPCVAIASLILGTRLLAAGLKGRKSS